MTIPSESRHAEERDLVLVRWFDAAPEHLAGMEQGWVESLEKFTASLTGTPGSEA